MRFEIKIQHESWGHENFPGNVLHNSVLILKEGRAVYLPAAACESLLVNVNSF
jgi:hypothetical protein